MIIGEYKNRVGKKKRVAIPKKLREQMGEGLILTRGYEGSLVLVNKEMWENIGKEVVNGSFINKNIRETTRFLIGSAVEITLDGQGRFVIPQSLYKYAELEDEVTFVGLINWVELWSSRRWEEKVQDVSDRSDEISSQLVKDHDHGE